MTVAEEEERFYEQAPCAVSFAARYEFGDSCMIMADKLNRKCLWSCVGDDPVSYKDAYPCSSH